MTGDNSENETKEHENINEGETIEELESRDDTMLWIKARDGIKDSIEKNNTWTELCRNSIRIYSRFMAIISA